MELNHQISQKRKFSLRSYLGCYMANVRPQQSHDDDELKPTSPSPTMWSSEVSDHRLIVLNLRVFTMSELKAATRNFSKSKIIGEGGFGPVYKGYVSNETKAEPVAVKLLNLNGHQGHKEWLAEVMYLGKLKHPNLVKLIGYCCEDEQRLLVYEYMVKGSLENHLFKGLVTTLPWRTRMKIAIGTAKGLAFLHESERPVIYRDLKTSNILLDSEYRAKLSDLGLARDGPIGDEKHVSTRVMGTQGYTAPEYILTGHLSTKSDVYSFGVVMLELLSGRRAIDETRASKEQRLVEWARPYLTDAPKLHRIMDPSLDGQYSAMGARKAAEVAYRCLSRCPERRPAMTAVADALEGLSELDDVPQWPLVYVASPLYVDVRKIYNT